MFVRCLKPIFKHFASLVPITSKLTHMLGLMFVNIVSSVELGCVVFTPEVQVLFAPPVKMRGGLGVLPR